MIDWLLALSQAMLFALLAPLFTAWVRRIKCWLQNRRSPALLQPYRDLRRLFSKHVVMAHNASIIFRLTPYIIAAATLLAAVAVPLIAVNLPTAAIADVIVMAGFFALARFFLALAGMDIGTAFGGMGSSREMTIAALAEPAMLMAIFTLAMVASSTNLSTVISHVLADGLVLRPSLLFAFLSLVLVGIAETGRIPVDNPATHLELTMIHEAMILEYSGRHLALIEWASQIKLMLYGVLIANIFFPWGIAETADALSLAIAFIAIVFKLMLLGIFLALGETVLAKMRLFRVPAFLVLALTLSVIGLLSHIILEIN
ncbi:MAG: NADH-quinone oxidoreductase subunit H [Gammaproteobacteria bacterium]|jgi:formate hydrogenlyase subunit 4|nr:NADH-quinone oxidoreductase subunit H [Gammaproteobacteria bacterium]